MRKVLHQALWRRIPREWRRAGLFAGTRALAPRPDPGATPAEPIVVAGALCSGTGLGQGARLCYEALAAAGFDVRAVDLSAALFQPLDLPDYAFRDGRACTGRGTLILHVNAPFVPLALVALGRRLVAEKWVVGYWAWELPVVPADWESGARFVHDIWVPSRFTADAVRARIAGRAVRVVPHPVAAGFEADPSRLRGSADAFTALCVFNMGSSFARKNPLGAVEAFRRACGDDPRCRIVVKASNTGLYPPGAQALREAAARAANISLIEDTLPAAQLAALYANASCLVSLHRSEGFGLVVAEAMLRGLPCVSTDWSGTTDFLDGDNGAPVSFRLVPARDPQGEYDHPALSWAEPDLDHAAAQIAALCDGRVRAEKGEAAEASARRRFGVAAYAEQVAGLLAPPVKAPKAAEAG